MFDCGQFIGQFRVRHDDGSFIAPVQCMCVSMSCMQNREIGIVVSACCVCSMRPTDSENCLLVQLQPLTGRLCLVAGDCCILDMGDLSGWATDRLCLVSRVKFCLFIHSCI